MRATITDIAEKTGLSITTISQVLNNKGQRFSKKTRDQIIEAARELNYRPNQLAVGLLTKKTKTIGLVIPDVCNIFFSEFAKGIENLARTEGYSVILCNSDDKFEFEAKNIQMLTDHNVDGIAIILSAESFGDKNEECLKALKMTGIPVILADCFNDVSGFNTIEIDNQKGSSIVVDYLLSLGHRRIGCIVGPQGLKSNKIRLKGYIDELEKNGIRPDTDLIYEGDFRYQSGYTGALELLPRRPTAIYCHNDMMAYGAMKALREKNLRIPDDISVVGFDDIFFSQHMDVPLTSIHQPAYQMGQQAGVILLEEIKNHNTEKRHIVFEPKLVVRQSTGTAPAEMS